MVLETPNTVNKLCVHAHFSRVSIYRILKKIKHTKNAVEALPLISGTRKRFLLSPLFNNILEFLANVIRQETEPRGIAIRNEKDKLDYHYLRII